MLVGVAGAASCASLPDIVPSTCGNGVTEPDHDEDCDEVTLDEAGKQTCYPAGSAGACHFDCSSATCPAGFSCGRDAVCRKPKGVFAEVGRPTQVSADRLFVGDFDEDGLGDVVAQTDVQMSVLYGDRSGALAVPFVVRAEGNPAIGKRALGLNPAVGQLALDPGQSSSESSTDLVFSKSSGVTTWRGRLDRTLVPTPYPSFEIGPNQPVLIVARILDLTDDVLLVLDGHQIDEHYSGSVVVRIRNSVLDETQFLGKIDGELPSDITGTPYVGQLDEASDSPCQEIVLAYGNGQSSVSMLYTCSDAKTVNVFPRAALTPGSPTGYKPPRPVALPLGFTVRPNGVGVIGGDVNGDGHVDLVIDAEGPGSASPQTTVVAYGLGDGTFSSSATLAPVDNAGSALALPDGPVLAVGQLTAKTDHLADVVFPDQVVLAALDGTGGDAGASLITPAPRFVADQPWTEAFIADIDGDGALDVVAGGANRVDLYKGTGTALVTHVPFVVEGDVGGFSLADFDGDHVLDVAFRATHPGTPTTPATSDLDVMWGRSLGVPDDPRFVGQFPNILGVQHGVTGGDIGNNDAIADLGVVTETQTEIGGSSALTYDVSVLAGSPTRQLQSVFYVQQPSQQAGSPRSSGTPLGFVVGQFDRDAHADLGILAAVLEDPAGTVTDLFDLKLGIVTGSGAALLSNPPQFTAKLDTFDSFTRNTGKRVPVADWTRASLVAVDLDGPGGDGVQEIVGVAPAIATAGSVFWAKLEGDQWTYEARTTRGVAASGDRDSAAQAVAADVNGDGADDVIVLTDLGTSTSLNVIINDKTGRLPDQTTPVSLPGYASGATETPFFVVSVAAIDADTDAGKEIAMLTDKGGLFLAKSNADGSAFTVTGPICSDGSALESCVNNPGTRIPGGSAVAAVDVDGDGVQDLVVETNQSLHVYKGVAVDP